MAPIAAAVGFYGKLPCRGDFLRRRVPQEFLDTWDEWLQSSLAHSRHALQEAWLDAYLTSPVWRFALAEGVCGTGAYAGVMVPSVDRVGRYFPLTIVAQWHTGESPVDAACNGHRWFDAAEALAMEAPDTVDFDAFDERVAQLAERIDMSGVGESAALRQSLKEAEFPHRAGQWHVRMESVGSIQRAVNAIAARELERTFRPLSLWWTDGSDRMPPAWLTTRGLPIPESFAAMMSGEYAKAGWNTVGRAAKSTVSKIASIVPKMSEPTSVPTAQGLGVTDAGPFAGVGGLGGIDVGRPTGAAGINMGGASTNVSGLAGLDMGSTSANSGSVAGINMAGASANAAGLASLDMGGAGVNASGLAGLDMGGTGAKAGGVAGLSTERHMTLPANSQAELSVEFDDLPGAPPEMLMEESELFGDLHLEIVAHHEPISRKWNAPPQSVFFVSRPDIGLWGISTSGSEDARHAAAQAVGDLLQSIPPAGTLSSMVEEVRRALHALRRQIARQGAGAIDPYDLARVIVFLSKDNECALICSGEVQAVRCRSLSAHFIIGVADFSGDETLPRTASSANSLLDIVTGADEPALTVRYESLQPGDSWLLAAAPLFDRPQLSLLDEAMTKSEHDTVSSLSAIRIACTPEFAKRDGPLPVLLLAASPSPVEA